MTAKKSFWLLPLLSICMFLAGCGSDSSPSPTSSKADLLFKTWIVDEVSVTGGVIYYKRGASNNQLDYSKAVRTFTRPNLHTITAANGITGAGTWKFLNNETVIETTFSSGPPVLATIKKLTSSNLDVEEYSATFKWIPK